jgi:hypothetical protein
VLPNFNPDYKSFTYHHHGLRTKKFKPNPTPHIHQCIRPWNSKLTSAAELRYQGIEYADNKCRPAFTGDVPFSHEYRKLALQARFWNHVVFKKAGRKVVSYETARSFSDQTEWPYTASRTTPLREYMASTKAEVDTKANAQHILYQRSKRSRQRGWNSWRSHEPNMSRNA